MFGLCCLEVGWRYQSLLFGTTSPASDPNFALWVQEMQYFSLFFQETAADSLWLKCLAAALAKQNEI